MSVNRISEHLDRPRALTPQVQAEIVRALGAGHFVSTACQLAGIGRQTFYYWKRLWEEGAEHAQRYKEFFLACARASAIAESEALSVVMAGGPGWRGAAWFLERRFPKRWGAKSKLTVAVDRLPADLSTLSDEELERIARGYEWRR